MKIQTVKYLFLAIFYESKGTLVFLWENIQSLVFPVLTMFFVLRYLPVPEALRQRHITYVFAVVLYFTLTLFPSRRLGQWFNQQKGSGFLEKIIVTEQGINGIVTMFFLIYIFIIYVLHLPIFLLAARGILAFDIMLFLNKYVIVFFCANIVLSYGLALFNIAILSIADIFNVGGSVSRIVSNFLGGVYVPVSYFPWWIKIFSYVLPFTYGGIILHTSIYYPAQMSFKKILPFVCIALSVAAIGKIALYLAMRYVRTYRSLSAR